MCDKTVTIKKDAFIVSKIGDKIRRDTTKVWEILIQWKDYSMTLEIITYVNKCYPFNLFAYYHQSQISQESEFASSTPQVMKKRNEITSKVNSRYWTCTNKYRLRIPKPYKEEI